MPSVERQTPPKKQSKPVLFNGDILECGIASSTLDTSKLNVALYGRNGVGKTTLACQGEGPIALLAIDPSPTGGARSVSREDVTVFYISADYLKGKDGKKETVKGSEKIMAIVEAIKARFDRGEKPFKKVVVDGLNSWFEVILCEIMRIDYNNLPAILKVGKVSTDQYTERTEKLIQRLRPILALPCDVWLLAQEKDHNPPRDEKNRVRGSKLMREEQAMAQEGSFFSLAISDEACRCVQNACDFIMQLYEDNEYKEEQLPSIEYEGKTIPGGTQLVETGKRVKRLRCVYHPNYMSRFRGDYRTVPEYIEAPTPEERYQAFLDAATGRRTKWGYYPPTE